MFNQTTNVTAENKVLTDMANDRSKMAGIGVADSEKNMLKTDTRVAVSTQASKSVFKEAFEIAPNTIAGMAR